ncbi:MAG: hypothetical protein M3Y55_01705, partial [Pseudomonadota bacterium]|nr:hypothetical protein [Pseudomonadota bacterium]
MAIDVHAHYFPQRILDELEKEGSRYGIKVVEDVPSCQCLHFDYGLKCRPLFSRLIEEPSLRVENMQKSGIDREVLSGWTDLFGYGLEPAKGRAWHRLMNESLAGLCTQRPESFSMLASSHLPEVATAARELEYAVNEL